MPFSSRSKINVKKGNPEGCFVKIYNTKTKKSVREWIFPAKCFGEQNRWGFSVPENFNPKDCQLIIYAGFPGKTIGNEIELENISLTTID